MKKTCLYPPHVIALLIYNRSLLGVFTKLCLLSCFKNNFTVPTAKSDSKPFKITEIIIIGGASNAVEKINPVNILIRTTKSDFIFGKRKVINPLPINTIEPINKK
jgi:hypothetical protein